MPRISLMTAGQSRDEYIFAIVLKDPSTITLQPGMNIKASSRIKDAEGYIGKLFCNAWVD